MRRLFLFFLLLFPLYSLWGQEAAVRDNSSAVHLKVSFSPSIQQQILGGKRPQHFIPYGAPGDPASYAKVFHVAIPSGSSVNLKVLEQDSAIRSARPFFLEKRIPEKRLSSGYYPDRGVIVSAAKKFRQVEYVDVYFFPVRFQPSANRAVVSNGYEVSLEFDRRGSLITESEPYASLNDRFFSNSWRDKGSVDRAAIVVPALLWAPPSHTGDAYKIKIRKNGIYKLDYNFLSANTTWNPGAIDPVNFRLLNRGVEIPILVTGEGDHTFDSGDAIYFYGRALTGENQAGVWDAGDFTDENVYWLVAGNQNGLRMSSRDVSPVQSYPVAPSFTSTEHFEENPEIIPFQNNPDTDLWLWKNASWIGSAVQHHNVTVPNASNNPAFQDSLRFVARGRSYSDTVNPDHHVLVRVNGTQVGDITADGYDVVDQTFTFNQSLLAGTGNVSVDFSHEVTDPALLGLTSDAVESNYWELTFSRSFAASSDELFFHYGAGNVRFQIPGYSGNDLLPLAINDPEAPVLLTGADIAPVSGNFQVTFDESIGGGGADYYVAVAGAPLAADFVRDIPSSLSSVPTNTHWIMIVPDDWTDQTAVQDLKTLRQNDGLNPQVVNVTDIYDEFNYGIFSPQAIHDFLQSVYESVNPAELQYVVLLGDAEYDYKDYLGDGNSNLVPTFMVADPGFGSAFHPYAMHSFDNYYVTYDGDAIPEVFLGRIPVRTTAQAADVLNKIRDYAFVADHSWLGKSLFAADCQDASAFEPVQEGNAAFLPATSAYSATKMYFAQAPWNCASKDADSNGIADIADQLNSGQAVSSWVGHGGFEQFGAPSYLHNTDVPALTNTTKQSVMLNANCFTGAFYHSQVPSSLMESLVAGSSGIVGGFAPGTYMFTFQASSATEPFYDDVYGRSKERLFGPLFQHLYMELSADRRVTEGMVALGDPATRLAIPAADAPENFQIAGSDCGSVHLTWSSPSGFSGSFSVYRSTDPDGLFARINGSPIATTEYTDGSLTPGATYYYYVVGLDSESFEGKGTPVLSFTAPSSGLTLSPASLPNGNAGSFYSQTLTPSGGNGNYTFSVNSGSLPDGLTLDTATGEISGIPTTPGTFNFSIKVVDTGSECGVASYAITISPACLFCDDFNDGQLSLSWTYNKGAWTEPAGALQGVFTKKATAIASPAFAGCAQCTVEGDLKIAGSGMVYLLGWYQSGNTHVELRMSAVNDFFMLKQYGNGTTKKKKVAFVVDPNVSYHAKIVFDGSNFNVYIDNTLIITMSKITATSPSGTVGFLVKSATGNFDSISVN